MRKREGTGAEAVRPGATVGGRDLPNSGTPPRTHLLVRRPQGVRRRSRASTETTMPRGIVIRLLYAVYLPHTGAETRESDDDPPGGVDGRTIPTVVGPRATPGELTDASRSPDPGTVRRDSRCVRSGVGHHHRGSGRGGELCARVSRDRRDGQAYRPTATISVHHTTAVLLGLSLG